MSLHDFTGGLGQRTSHFRFELLDQTNSSIGDLTVSSDSRVTIANNIHRTVKRTMNGLRLPPSETARINTLRDRVRPWMVMQDGTEYPLGVFLFADASRTLMLSSGGYYQAVGEGWFTDGTMVDQLATLNQGTRGIDFYVPGTRLWDALIQQMESAGVVNYDIDPDVIDVILGKPRVWKPTEKRLRIINDLLALGSYYSMWFNGLGRGQLRAVPAIDAAEPVVEYGPGSVYADSIVETDNLLDAPNVYVAVNTGMTERPIWGEWRIPAAAPHSFENRGFWVTKQVEAEGATSSAGASSIARAHGKADYSTYRFIDFETPPDGRLDTFDVFRWLDGDKYRLQSTTLTCEEGARMKVEGRRVWTDEVADLIIEDDDGELG